MIPKSGNRFPEEIMLKLVIKVAATVLQEGSTIA
jgi:hypothetical protein